MSQKKDEKKGTPLWTSLIKVAVLLFGVSMYVLPEDEFFLSRPIWWWGVVCSLLLFILAIAFGIAAVLSRNGAADASKAQEI